MGYQNEWTPVSSSDVPCRKCGEKGHIEYREWESSCGGFEDYHYRCNSCSSDWWVEGADS